MHALPLLSILASILTTSTSLPNHPRAPAQSVQIEAIHIENSPGKAMGWRTATDFSGKPLPRQTIRWDECQQWQYTWQKSPERVDEVWFTTTPDINVHYHIIFYASKDCKDEYGYLPDANLVADFQKKNVAVAITKEGQSSSGWLRNGAEQPIPFKNGAEVFQTMKAFKVGKEECKKGYKKSPNGNFVTCQRA